MTPEEKKKLQQEEKEKHIQSLPRETQEALFLVKQRYDSALWVRAQEHLAKKQLRFYSDIRDMDAHGLLVFIFLYSFSPMLTEMIKTVSEYSTTSSNKIITAFYYHLMSKGIL